MYWLLMVLSALDPALAGADPPRRSMAEIFSIAPDARLHHVASSLDREELEHYLGKPETDVNEGASSSGLPHLNGITPLMVAAAEGWIEGVELLLQHGADVTLTTKNGSEVLHFAAPTGCVPCIDLLLDAGARVNAKKEHGGMPLHIAGRSLEIVQRLVEHGAQVDEDSICYVSLYNFEDGVEIIRLLFEHDPPIGEGCFDSPELSGPLAAAIEHDNTDVAFELIRLLPPDAIDVVDEEGNSAFLTAAGKIMTARCEVMTALLERGVNPTRVNKQSENALHLAASTWSRCECFREIVQMVGDIDQRDIAGRTPLMRVSGYEADCRVAVLVEHGAEVGARDNRGDTALHIALKNDSPFVAKALIEVGADIHLPDSEGKLPTERVEDRLRRNHKWLRETWEDVWEIMIAQSRM